MSEDDTSIAVLKEKVRTCREKIRKRMLRSNIIVSIISWKSILTEMRRKSCDFKLKKEVEGQLKAWFELLEEFPKEKSLVEHSFANITMKKTDLHIVQPGDLWMDCGSLRQEDSLIGSRSSDASSIESSTHDMPEVILMTQLRDKPEKGFYPCE